MAVSAARGVALVAVVQRTDNLYEYTPMQIKQAVTGYGGADKHQVQQMVKMLLNMRDIARPDDAADALAIALCHGFTGRFGDMYAVGNMTRTKGNNTAPASAYRELMEAGKKSTKRGKSSAGFSSASTAA